MVKYIIFWGLLLTVFLVFPSIAKATPSILPFGDTNKNLDPDQEVTITVTGLDPDKTYAWEIKKFTDTTHFPGFDPYTPFSTNCFKSDNSGKITQKLSFLNISGYYRLGIFKGTMANSLCTTIDNRQTYQDFSVGGPVSNSPDPDKGKICCDWDWADYDPNKNICRKLGLITRPEKKTNCAIDPNTRVPINPPTFCEPKSLKCFKAPSFVVSGKICNDPDTGPNPVFDPARNIGIDKYIVCAKSNGKDCTNDTSNPGIATAIGCIHTNPVEFVKDLMTWIIGIGGGLAFLMMLLGAFQMLTSAGNPETLAAGRSRLTSAVIGLLFVIFAVLLMQIIGFDILKLPGFGRL